MLRIETDRKATPPGGEITAKLAWERAEKKDRRVKFDVVLLWFTEGAGDTDVGIVDVKTFDSPEKKGAREITFTLPAGPESFHGNLIQIKWAVEVRTDRGEIDRVEFDMGRFIPSQNVTGTD